MNEKVIYDEKGSVVAVSHSKRLIHICAETSTSMGEHEKYNASSICLWAKELDAIHAAIHADDEPEPEADCCGNCACCVGGIRVSHECHGGHPAAGLLDADRWPPVELDEWCYQHHRKE